MLHGYLINIISNAKIDPLFYFLALCLIFIQQTTVFTSETADGRKRRSDIPCSFWVLVKKYVHKYISRPSILKQGFQKKYFPMLLKLKTYFAAASRLCAKFQIPNLILGT